MAICSLLLESLDSRTTTDTASNAVVSEFLNYESDGYLQALSSAEPYVCDFLMPRSSMGL
jgi:hypothetical protein